MVHLEDNRPSISVLFCMTWEKFCSEKNFIGDVHVPVMYCLYFTTVWDDA